MFETFRRKKLPCFSLKPVLGTVFIFGDIRQFSPIFTDKNCRASLENQCYDQYLFSAKKIAVVLFKADDAIIMIKEHILTECKEFCAT
jgi:hypothetical protein